MLRQGVRAGCAVRSAIDELRSLAERADNDGLGEVMLWVGSTPEGAPDQVAQRIVAQAFGWQTAHEPVALVTAGRDEAAMSLTLIVGGADRVMGSPSEPSPEVLAEVASVLGRFGPEAHFYANGRWRFVQVARRNSFSQPIPPLGLWKAALDGRKRRINLEYDQVGWFERATFEAVVIGFDAEKAFLLWEGQED